MLRVQDHALINLLQLIVSLQHFGWQFLRDPFPEARALQNLSCASCELKHLEVCGLARDQCANYL